MLQDAGSKELLVNLRDISKHYGEGETRVDALRNVSLEIHAAEVVALLGPSGSGKTTLLNVIGCIVEASGGWMQLDGDVVYDGRWMRSDLRKLRLDKIGFIFQFHNLLPFLDATDNVALVLHLAGFDAVRAKARAVELLDYLEVSHRRSAFPAQLSGGEALDSKRAGIVMDLLRKVAGEQKAAIIAVTHDEKIFDRFDRIYDLRDGRLSNAASLAA
jgi:putative ABC transport system ATP-binding protein